jgi:hypothetical protein
LKQQPSLTVLIVSLAIWACLLVAGTAFILLLLSRCGERYDRPLLGGSDRSGVVIDRSGGLVISVGKANIWRKWVELATVEAEGPYSVFPRVSLE